MPNDLAEAVQGHLLYRRQCLPTADPMAFIRSSECLSFSVEFRE